MASVGRWTCQVGRSRPARQRRAVECSGESTQLGQSGRDAVADRLNDGGEFGLAGAAVRVPVGGHDALVGDELVPAASVAPRVLIHAQDSDTVEAGRVGSGLGARPARSPNIGSGGCGRAGSFPASRAGRAPVGAARCRAAPPNSRTNGESSGSTTRQSNTAWSGCSCWPTTSKPRSSSRQNVVRSAAQKVAHEPRAQSRSSGSVIVRSHSAD